jgi:hypothetical protein
MKKNMINSVLVEIRLILNQHDNDKRIKLLSCNNKWHSFKVAIVFKDLQKLVFKRTRRKHKKGLFERLQDKPFWIWNIDVHKQEDSRTNGGCCLNHIIGLQRKYETINQLYEHEKIISNSLVASYGALTINTFG